MPLRRRPVLQHPTARAILAELELYAKDRQFYPLEHSLFIYMTKGEDRPELRKHEPGRYPEMTWGSWHHWFERLVEEGYIEIDFNTRAIRCLHLEIVEKDDSPLA